MNEAGDPLAKVYAHCFDVVREGDRDLWLASLFWPADVRPHAHAILAFGLEIARVRELVSDPTLGEIRYQFWRDILDNDASAGHPVAQALLDTVERFNLDKGRLLALIEARSFDLYDDAMPNEAALENYLRDTASVLFEAIARVLAPGRLPPPCVDAAGRAYGLVGLLRGLPYQVMRGQLFLPLDLLKHQQLPPEDVLAHRNSPGLGLVLQTLRTRARLHVHEMRESLLGAGAARAACLPAVLCEPYLRRMEAPGLDPFATPVELPQWRRQWALWRGALRL